MSSRGDMRERERGRGKRGECVATHICQVLVSMVDEVIGIFAYAAVYNLKVCLPNRRVECLFLEYT